MKKTDDYIKNRKYVNSGRRSTIRKDDYFCVNCLLALLFFMVIVLSIIVTREINFVQANLEDHLLEDIQITPIPTSVPTSMPTITPAPRGKILAERTFKITGFCACVKCCKKTDGVTASGAIVKEGITCAADWSVLAPGTIVDIEGIGIRTVQDKGSSVKGDHIDVYMTDHQAALKFGVQYRTVKILEVAP